MHNRMLFLAALALIAVGAASGDMTRIPASQDVYFNLASEQVFNKTDILSCEVAVTEINGSKEESFAGVPMVQFDISGLNMTDDDIGILVLKAASVQKPENDSAMVAVMPISSEWNEDSDFIEFLMNFLPVWGIVKNNDISQMGISTDADKILAFDVSTKLKDAKSNGDLISFLMLPISNSSYKVDFMSRETGSGPYLIVMPYLPETMENLTEIMPTGAEGSGENGAEIADEMGNETAEMASEKASIFSNESMDLNQTAVAAINVSSQPA